MPLLIDGRQVRLHIESETLFSCAQHCFFTNTHILRLCSRDVATHLAPITDRRFDRAAVLECDFVLSIHRTRASWLILALTIESLRTIFLGVWYRSGGLHMFSVSKGAVSTWLGVCVVAAPLALAAPTISSVAGGPLSAGQPVTITGSGFGTKANAQPVLWDNFEGGAIGKQIQGVPAAIGRWDTGNGSDNVTYTNEKSHSGTGAARHDFMHAYNASLAKNMTFTRLYMDFGWSLTTSISSRATSSPGVSTETATTFSSIICGCAMAPMDWVVHSSTRTFFGGLGGPQYSKGTWMHFQLVYNDSSPGQPNGTVRHFINSQVAGLDSGAAVTETVPAHFDRSASATIGTRGLTAFARPTAGRSVCR